MRIGILTQPLRNNYGGLLQNYALQKVLIAAGHEPITLDQGDKRVSKLHLLAYQIKRQIQHSLNPVKYKRPIYRLSAEEETIVRKNTKYFIDKYIKHTRILRSIEDIRIESEQLGLEGFVVGSDQCWRASYNYHFSAMFLSFIENNHLIKKIAYAASFGINTWELNEKKTEPYKKWASEFDIVTVRESSGMDICSNVLGVDSIHVLDPTMLLRIEDYCQLIYGEKEPESTGDLFYYILDPSSKKKAFIKEICTKNRMKSFMVLPKYKEEYCTRQQVKNDIEACVYPRVTQWLRAFMDAKMTIVDSFHGTVFSILFNKPFWVIKNGDRGNARFTSLLSIFGLENRLVDENMLDLIDFNTPVDWEPVNKILEEKRTFCKDLLINYLK